MLKGYKLMICAAGVFVALIAAATAVIIFKNEIIDLFAAIKEKIEDKRSCKCSDFADYADL